MIRGMNMCWKKLLKFKKPPNNIEYPLPWRCRKAEPNIKEVMFHIGNGSKYKINIDRAIKQRKKWEKKKAKEGD